MPLADFLSEENKRQEEIRSKQKEAQEKQQNETTEFHIIRDKVYNEVIVPSVNQIVQTFKDNKYEASATQVVQKSSHMGEKTASLSVNFRGIIFQFDITSLTHMKAVEATFRVQVQHQTRSISSPNAEKIGSYKPTDITRELLESIVEKTIKDYLAKFK